MWVAQVAGAAVAYADFPLGYIPVVADDSGLAMYATNAATSSGIAKRLINEVGRMAGVRPGDLVGALAEQTVQVVADRHAHASRQCLARQA